MKDSHQYFSHDYNARTDEKIRDLLLDHGMTGYGVYWSIIEDLYNNANAMRTNYKRIAYDLHADENMVQSIVESYGLFKVENDFFSSDSVAKRLELRSMKSVKARESAYKSWENRGTNANAKRTHSDSNAIKERKGNKGKKDDDVEPTPSTSDDPMQYYRERYYAMRKDQLWVDSVLKSFSISPIQLRQHLKNFFLMCSGEHKRWPNQADCNKHFRSWIQKQPLLQIEVTDPDLLAEQKNKIDDFYNSRMSTADRVGFRLRSTDEYILEGEEGEDED